MRNQRDAVKTPSANLLDKVSNGRLLSKSVDLRTAAGRRFRHLVQSHIAEFGGVDNLTEADLGLIKQSVALQLQAEQMQEAIVRGEKVDADALIRISGISRRLLETISVKAEQSKPVLTPLQAWHAARAAEAATDADTDADEGTE
jgi:hypothetical protein